MQKMTRAVLPPSPPYTTTASHNGSEDESSGFDDRIPMVSSRTPRPYPLAPECKPVQVLPEDLSTPDKHVERDARLIRLTGIHPFNVEAPIKDLFDEGFITSENLHYVRNHGAVPVCDDEDILDWTFEIGGMVDRPFTMSVRDLIQDYEQATYPVTLVCAGNRRKEQNVVQKSKGFSWGPAGLSTALWTGVPIGELLTRARPKRGAKYVCFEGADKLPNGFYGTSVRLPWCTDPHRGIMVAHKMNGTSLHPDHGKPVRVIIPGQIGGRSVKWLKKITITADPSDNWYHVYDNRVLPTTISPEMSDSVPEVWKDERHAIYDLNVNSAVCYPDHEETVSLRSGQKSYKARGYAYGGGGRRITRLEVTLDKGQTWRSANIRYPEDEYREAPEGDVLYGGKLDMWWRDLSYCWCFWELDIPLSDLEKAPDLMIRAMDESMMVQPRDMYWSVLGMMNNCWFRVVIHKEGDSLRFEHPTQPALRPGGWMQRIKKAGGNLMDGYWGESSSLGPTHGADVPEPKPQVGLVNPAIDNKITIGELRQHNGEDQPWFVVNGEVYDGTPFLDEHPGGPISIFGAAGQDASEEFLAIRTYTTQAPADTLTDTSIDSQNAMAMMPKYHIGTLDDAGRAELSSAEEPALAEDGKQTMEFLHPKQWRPAVLTEKAVVSPDTTIFTFSLDHEDQLFGLPIGQHVLARISRPSTDPSRRESIIRAYTPISEASDRGKLRMLVKIYRDHEGSRGGSMTKALDLLPVGETIDLKGPVGRFEVLGNGVCSVAGRERKVSNFYMVCAGSGITPMYRVLRAVLRDREVTSASAKFTLLYGNRTENDILCHDELEQLAKDFPDQCFLLHALTRPSESWKGQRGRINASIIEREVKAPGADEEGKSMVLICGPPEMEVDVGKILQGMGWKDDDVFVF